MVKFIRVTESDNSIYYIPLHLIKEISVVDDKVNIRYGDEPDGHWLIETMQTEAEIAQQINQ